MSQAIEPELASRRKRLGQFFSGDKLATLLARLADAGDAKTIIDPMAGSGDMLIACIRQHSDLAEALAVEIDPTAIQLCRTRLQSAIEKGSCQVFEGDAFAPGTWEQVGFHGWDLVITNPPYVRYQRGAESTEHGITLPSAAEVRQGVLDVIDQLPHLTPKVGNALRQAATEYSGLSDLAVPSWILCAALVGEKGRLAMVMPGTWLTRRYANPIRTLLDELFRVRYIVQDRNAAWFPDALVRTTLLIAERRPSAELEAESSPSELVATRIGLDRSAMDGRSVVGSLFPESPDPEGQFMRLIGDWEAGKKVVVPAGCLIDRLNHPMDQTRAGASTSDHHQAISGDPGIGFTNLTGLGWRAGQGLRTGANTFFYVDQVETRGSLATVRVNPTLGTDTLELPDDLLKSVVRRQAEVRNCLGVDPNTLSGRLLCLWGYALPEDLERARHAGAPAGLISKAYAVMPDALAEYVRRAGHTAARSTDSGPREISHLSAVVTNVRHYNPGRPDIPPLFWYHLPSLAPRHQPVLFVPRVNSSHPTVRWNTSQLGVVDANFSTLWPVTEDALSPGALFALMSSSWTKASLESLGTVLGGGALKIEASDFSRFVLPSAVSEAAAALDKLGKQLVAAPEAKRLPIEESVDELVWRLVAGAGGSASLRSDLLAYAEDRREARQAS